MVGNKYRLARESLMDTPARSNGIQVTIKSLNQPWRGGERYRTPSYLACIIHPEIIEKSNNGITGFLELGKEAWNISQGVYGFIDIETGIPLQDNIYRNFDLQMSNLIPSEFFDEFRNWQRIGPELHRKAWKVFWGNFLGEEHIQQIGGVSELKKANPYKQTDELASIAYQVGLEKITACKCFYEMSNLTHKGVLITMSNTPYDWDQQNNDDKGKLQQVLSPIITSQ